MDFGGLVTLKMRMVTGLWDVSNGEENEYERKQNLHMERGQEWVKMLEPVEG